MISVRDATPERWDDVVTVMGTRGYPAFCWCQYFRLRGAAWSSATREQNREALRCQVAEDAAPPGVLAYRDGEAVGWCAVAPRTSYERLGYAEIARAVDPVPALWSVTCFVVRVGHRRAGVARALLDGALDLAARHGAAAVEAYPVDVAVKKVSAADLYHGTLSMFAGAGFVELARPRPHRPVVRRTL